MIALSLRQVALVLEAEPNEQVHSPVGHVYDLLHTTLDRVVARQEVQFPCKLVVAGGFDEFEKPFRYLSLYVCLLFDLVFTPALTSKGMT